ncbi:SDR family oxidoreductase [Ramlibacter tataouinensis]|uniref:SDR family oxidoreductase n=1 Tax=Ramlibacter tataouinensis TaxID=94132 RepID=UPI0022F3BDA3|nr:SDR family oxidoreductase [Ramlibacter tataouinensis]WBY03622.1 SDR family oxidoreductase [Ramlibacter tataouinensis]
MTRWTMITGGSRRLGREICMAFAQRGWNIVCHYRDSAAEAGDVVEQARTLGVQALALQGSLDSEGDAESLFHRACAGIGEAPSCIVNNASTFLPDAATDFVAQSFLRQLQTNLLVPLVLGKLLHASWSQASHASGVASVVNVLDQKVYNLNPDYYSYTLTKLALERATIQQAQALAPTLRVNSVVPGLMYPSGPQTLENFRMAASANLLRRPVEPARVAEAVFFMASNDGITGTSVCVDNGQHLVPLPRDIMFVVDDLLRKNA